MLQVNVDFMITPYQVERNHAPIKRKRVPKGTGINLLVNEANPFHLKPSINMVTQLMKEIDRFVVPFYQHPPHKNSNTRKERLGKVYAGRSAEDMADRQKITVGAWYGLKPVKKKLWGCHQECLVLEAALTKAGVSAKLFRYIKQGPTFTYKSHSLVIFRIKDKIFAADPYNMKIFPFDITSHPAGKFIKPVPFSFEEFQNQLKTQKISDSLVLENQSLP